MSSIVKKIVIIGATGNALDIADIIIMDPSAVLLGFIDDFVEQDNFNYLNYKIIGSSKEITSLLNDKDIYFINSIGSSSSHLKKLELISGFNIPNNRFTNVIHPSTFVSESAEIGLGVTILAGVSISAQAKIFDHVMILPNSTINHDCKINEGTIITSNVSISGYVEIGNSCYIGTNTSIREKVKIGNGSLIGMGSVVLSDVDDNSTVFGVPARVQGPV